MTTPAVAERTPPHLPAGQSPGVTPASQPTSAGPGTFTATGPLGEGRTRHTATLLTDGRVLVAGGETGEGLDGGVASGTVAVAELYDPAAGTFAPTGALDTPRFDHTATLLPGGRVLVAGGQAERTGDDASLATAELYDPSNGTFAPTGGLVAPRSGHHAVALADGRVLIAGGAPPWDPSSPAAGFAERYDPAAGTFGRVGSLPATLAVESMIALADGRVLIVGAMMPTVGVRLGAPGRSGIVLAATPQVTAVAFLFDPATDAIVPTGAPLVPPGEAGSVTGGHTATLLADGRVLLAGGEGTLFMPQLYDPSTGTFELAGAMISQRAWHTATRLADGRVLIAGGYGGSGAIGDSELYDPAAGGFVKTGPLQVARMAGHTATPLNDGSVLVVGGVEALAGPGFAEAEVYR